MKLSPGIVLAAAAVLGAAAAAVASDASAFADLRKRYEKAAKNHDDDGIRQRRKLVLECFDFLDQKECRKLLRDSFDGADDATDTRTVTVQVLGASGDPKDLEFLVKGFAKDKIRAPAIALGEGIACTAPEAAATVSARALELAAKAKGDVRFGLLEGVAELGSPAAYDALAAFGEKATPDELFIRNVGLGACGKEKAVAALVADVKAPNPVVRLGAVLGLAKTGAKEALPPMTDALRDLDPRVVAAAARALGEAKHQPATAALVDLLGTAPLSVRCDARAALAAIHGKDFGLDAAPWRAFMEGKKPEPPVVAAGEPKMPSFFGIPVASDRAVVVLDLGRRMSWMGRLPRAQDGIVAWLDALEDDASFNVWTCAKLTDRFSKGMTGGAAARAQAQAWVRKQLTSSGFNLKACLQQILDEEREADTILLATDSMPWGDGAPESAMEVIEQFRRANLTRRVKLHVAFIVPGGRLATSEPDEEFQDRAVMLELLAKTAGGSFVRIDQ
jgi:HEAT repeat protein